VASGLEANQPAAKNMKKLSWDCDLEISAQNYVDKCVDEVHGELGIGKF